MVSIIIPSHNRAHTLLRALNSVAGQSYENWELILVDDGSTDSTESLVAEWATSLPSNKNFSYIKTPQQGVSLARNTGASQALGDWLAFLDSDDEWLTDKLERQSALMGNVQWIHGEEIWIRNGVRVNAMKKHVKSGGRIFSRSVELCCVSPSATLLRRELFEECGGFSCEFPVCEDYELWLRLSARFDVGFIKEPVVMKFGGHDDQLSKRFKAMDYFRVRALHPFLKSEQITCEERLLVAKTIIEKCHILLNGYRKHKNTENVTEVEGWLEQAQMLTGMAQHMNRQVIT